MYVEGIFFENSKMTKINCSFNHFTIFNLTSGHDFYLSGGGGGVYLYMLGNFACFLSSAEIVKINFFKKLFQEYHQSVKTVWTHIRPNKMSGLVWVQTVCRVYQQTIKVATSRERVILYGVTFDCFQIKCCNFIIQLIWIYTVE